jgi:hypothetical protein
MFIVFWKSYWLNINSLLGHGVCLFLSSTISPHRHCSIVFLRLALHWDAIHAVLRFPSVSLVLVEHGHSTRLHLLDFRNYILQAQSFLTSRAGSRPTLSSTSSGTVHKGESLSISWKSARAGVPTSFANATVHCSLLWLKYVRNTTQFCDTLSSFQVHRSKLPNKMAQAVTHLVTALSAGVLTNMTEVHESFPQYLRKNARTVSQITLLLVLLTSSAIHYNLPVQPDMHVHCLYTVRTDSDVKQTTYK